MGLCGSDSLMLATTLRASFPPESCERGDVKDFRDPLYGFVSVDDLEERIIGLQVFQRMRHIAQLGTGFLVYPSASHTRFEHCLGTLQASTIIFDRLMGQKTARELLKWSDGEIDWHRRILRLSSLLHDVGHSPFSHAAEHLLPGGVDHETLTARMIRETEIAELIDEALGAATSDLVARIAAGEVVIDRDALLLREVLTGDLGSDRLDYLRRDSHHLGVAYGHFDMARFILGLELAIGEDDDRLQLMIEDGAVQSVEGILLARYFMFLQVYFHKTRRILDHHLVEAIQELLLGDTYPEGLQEYIDWDDNRILEAFRELREDPLVRRVLAREHFRCVFETLEHPPPDEVVRFEWLQETLIARFGFESLYFDEATKDPYNFITPPIRVRTDGGPKGLEERSSLVHSLKPIAKMRVYADLGIRKEVEDGCRQFEEEHHRRTR